ncbi:recQ-mediated genome instability protein 1 [Puntigrus tetrazona]|uniref:recQ-mediated genome instability protein 1 n=1 Tax=Puntigrus tetrazona TaxID=1606681 RepID=UPI001C896F80|nr:recQ-mediated genome instability protein 1 [Puntigrus tetrazona]XP_043103917.1 recQ-mediated genome instability protein 1 [Puntigrus tetrazona]XP_043103918.1 recQ-mediated genome instability protein 1 [Puntigrus tetrazona]
MSVGEVQVTQAWLRSQWHIQVPHAWLDACVNWIKEEAESEAVPQMLLNQRVLEQWLLTDLRDLSHPVLPERISEAQKTELSTCFCLQMDSLLDVSQPAYTQLQRIRGTDCSNDQVSAVTQETQRPWEAKPTRMLMLQLTDGVQSLEGMEYRPIPALSTNLAPGTKIQLVGPIAVRLGVLLLKAENVKVLGGEVEQLLELYSQSRVLCGTLGLPEESHPQAEEPDDLELLASVEAPAELQVADSGYDSMASDTYFRPAWPQPRLQAAPNLREDDWDMDEIPDDDFRSIPDDFDHVPQNVEDDAPEDFDDIPLEELESVMSPIDCKPNAIQSRVEEPSLSRFRTTLRVSDAFVAGSSANAVEEPEANLSNQPKTEEPSQTFRSKTLLGTTSQGRIFNEVPHTSMSSSSTNTAGSLAYLPAPPYLCVLQAGHWSPAGVRVLQLQAFIVTLKGNLRSSSGAWKLEATISDGSGYLDVDLSDAMLTELIGYTAAEARVLRKDPSRRAEVDRGILHCQRELVDMCCMMSVQVDETGRGAVLRVSPLSDKDCSEIQKRVKERRN